MGKLKDYQVIDVLNGGTFYKVRHKVTNNIFAWKAYNCSAYSDQQIQIIAKEVNLLSKVLSESLLRYYETILHGPSKTLYLVVEYNRRRSVHELIATCKATDKFISEHFVWRLLFESARVCKLVEDLNFVSLAKCVTESSIFVDEDGELRFDCFEVSSSSARGDLMRQVGDVLRAVCYQPGVCDDDKIKQFHYSDDLGSIVSFIADNRDTGLRPDVILYHPTVLAHLETSGPKKISEILIPVKSFNTSLVEINKCDSDKAIELSQQSPNAQSIVISSPIYSNIISKRKYPEENEQSHSDSGSLSPTLAALALELPGFVPRSRKPISVAVEEYANPKHVSEVTLSQQWMSRLIALRQREESLNKRERDIIAKEMANSPNVKIVPFKDTSDRLVFDGESDGITLPPIINQVSNEETVQASRRRRRRRNPVKANNRRKTFAYEDLDSSLSADAGDGSIIVTAKKITKDNMPCRNVFSDLSTKKVQFMSANPFVESDESVTLTFYDLENMECNRYQLPKCDNKVSKDITKFKYLDLEKNDNEKRAPAGRGRDSPSKGAKIRADPFNNTIKKTPSKSSLTSKGSCSSRYSMMSARSHWSAESAPSETSDSNVSDRTRSGVRQSFAPGHSSPPKRKVRKSLLPFKTPFKFNKTSTRV